MLFDEVQSIGEIFFDFRPFLSLEELRAGSYQCFYHTHTVGACPAARLRNLLFCFRTVFSLRRDKMEVILASARIHIRIAGIFLLRPLVMSFDMPDLRALVFRES